MLVSCMSYWYIFSPGKTNTRRATWTLCFFTPIWFWLARLFYQWQQCTRKPYTWQLYIRTGYTWFWLVWPNAGLMHELLVYFFGQERPTQEDLHGLSAFFTPIWLWLARLFYKWQQCTRKPYTWFWLVWPNAGLTHELLVHFLVRKSRKANTRSATRTFWSSYVNMILACSSVLPLTAIHNNSLYMILGCVAKGWSYAWIIGAATWTLCFFTPIWFWLVWPNAGPLHELLVHFLARKGQHKKRYVDVLVFLPQYGSGLCACSTSDSYI